MKITNLIKSLFLATVVLSSCTQEPMIGPNIEITTTLDAGDVAYAGEPFVIRFVRDKADFYSVYTGRDAANTYGIPGATGTYLNSATDSILITYPAVGQYTLAIVASSTGNQGAEFETKVDSILITVYDRRATFAAFNYYVAPTPPLIGTINGTAITADYTDYPGANYLFKPTYITSSPNAKVYINEIKEENLQTSGQNEYDFSNADEVPLKYIVVSPTGIETEYSVTIVKKEAPTEAKLFFIQNLESTDPLDTASPILDEATNKWAIDLICNNSDWTSTYRFNISASFGASIKLYRVTDKRWLAFSPSSATKYQINAIDSIRIISQSKTDSTTYGFEVYDKLLSSFEFTGIDGKELYPIVNGAIDLGANTITVNMSKAFFVVTDPATKKEVFNSAAEKFIAKWETGATKVKVGDIDVQSGVTELNFKLAKLTDRQVKKTFTFILGNLSFNIDVIINLTD